jgi:beta-lactam-binding protein with PASTA domain
MKSVYGFVALYVLLCGMAVALVGCAAHRPQGPGEATRLEDIESTVPKLTGLPLKNAQKVLAILALKVGEVTLYETDDPELHGQVFEQDPAPGTPARGGTAVNVKVYRFVPPAEESSSTEEK